MGENTNTMNKEGQLQWNKKASFWDQLHGDEGNTFHRELVSPAVEDLLQLKAGEKILDIACGNGTMARRLALLGANVTAVDFSDELIELARKRGGTNIDYNVVDATDEDALTRIGSFDAIICTMALMDIPTISPLFRAVAQMLVPGGRFVFVTAHPCFNSTNPSFLAEMSDEDGEIKIQHSLKISSYFGIPPIKAVGARDEPSPHYFYHRTLQELLEAGFEVGMLMNGLLEPRFPDDLIEPMKLKFWSNTPSMPPVLAGRFIQGN